MPSTCRISSRVGPSSRLGNAIASVIRTMPPAVVKVVSSTFVSGR
jgi:hypothetical protein